MKKLLTLVLMGLMMIPVSFAQKGLHIGANYMYLSSSIVNQNVWGLGREYDYKITYNSSFGLDVGYNFNERMGLYTGFWMTNLGQGYTDEYDNSTWERNLDFKYNLIPVMMRFSNSLNRVHFLGGVGVSFAFLSEAKQEWYRDGELLTSSAIDPEDIAVEEIAAVEVTNRFQNSDIFVNVELGLRVYILDQLYVDASLFGAYGMKDINAADWQIPDNDGVYNASHNAFGGAKVGVAYVLFGN